MVEAALEIVVEVAPEIVEAVPETVVAEEVVPGTVVVEAVQKVIEFTPKNPTFTMKCEFSFKIPYEKYSKL